MSSMPSIIEEKSVTGEELFAMEDLGSCELVEGRIVSMSPTKGKHGLIEFRIAKYLDLFVSGKNLGWVMTGEVGIYTRRNPDTVRGADVLFISKKNVDKIHESKFFESAELIVEVLSPSDYPKEIEQKITEYFSIDVKWVWLVDPQKRILLFYRSLENVRTLTENDTLIGDDILAGFELKISKLFEE